MSKPVTTEEACRKTFLIAVLFGTDVLTKWRRK